MEKRELEYEFVEKRDEIFKRKKTAESKKTVNNDIIIS